MSSRQAGAALILLAPAVAGLPARDYYLTFDAGPLRHWLETDDTNNRSWAKFRR